VDLNPVAVELDLMEPLVALGRSGFEGGELRLNESRHLRFLGRQPTGTHTLGHDSYTANSQQNRNNKSHREVVAHAAPEPDRIFGDDAPQPGL
jgi:hypothetical protein